MIKDKLVRILQSNQVNEFLKYYKDDEDYLNKINNDWIKIRKNLNTDNLTAKMLYNYIKNYYKYKNSNFGVSGGSKPINIPENKILKDSIDMDKPVPMDIDYEKPKRSRKPKARTSKGRASRGGKTGRGGGIHQIVKVYLASQQDKQPTIISSTKPSHIVDTRSMSEKNKVQQQQLPNITISPNISSNISPSITSTIEPKISPVIKPSNVVKPTMSNTTNPVIKPIIKPSIAPTTTINPTLNNTPSFVNEPTLRASISTTNNPNISPLFEVNNKPVNESTFYPNFLEKSSQKEGDVGSPHEEEPADPPMEQEDEPTIQTTPDPTPPFMPKDLIPPHLLDVVNKQEHTGEGIKTNNIETSFLDPNVWATQGGGGAVPSSMDISHERKRGRFQMTPTPPRPKRGEQKEEEDVKMPANETIQEEEEIEQGISGKEFSTLLKVASNEIKQKLEKEKQPVPEQTKIRDWLIDYIHSQDYSIQKKWGENPYYYKKQIAKDYLKEQKEKSIKIKVKKVNTITIKPERTDG